MRTAEGEYVRVEQVVYKHLGWPDASNSIFSSTLARFQIKKGRSLSNQTHLLENIQHLSLSTQLYIASSSSILHSNENTLVL